jgi:DUF1365 family protein
MNPAIFTGHVAHERNLPKQHRFSYPFFMWYLNLDRVDQIEDLGRWFSTTRFALSRFNRSDYLGNHAEPIHISVKKRMEELTGSPVQGEIHALMNLRTLGLYFSPVNFYFGHDANGEPSHFLAEVSNIPWNRRHQYGFQLQHKNSDAPEHRKAFHVSPFNPMEQRYRWHIDYRPHAICIAIEIHDKRGHVMTARVDLARYGSEPEKIQRKLAKTPAMTATIVRRIYWQALKLYLKGVPYQPYREEPTQ